MGCHSSKQIIEDVPLAQVPAVETSNLAPHQGTILVFATPSQPPLLLEKRNARQQILRRSVSFDDRRIQLDDDTGDVGTVVSELSMDSNIRIPLTVPRTTIVGPKKQKTRLSRPPVTRPLKKIKSEYYRKLKQCEHSLTFDLEGQRERKIHKLHEGEEKDIDDDDDDLTFDNRTQYSQLAFVVPSKTVSSSPAGSQCTESTLSMSFSSLSSHADDISFPKGEETPTCMVPVLLESMPLIDVSDVPTVKGTRHKHHRGRRARKSQPPGRRSSSITQSSERGNSAKRNRRTSFEQDNSTIEKRRLQSRRPRDCNQVQQNKKR